MNYWIVKAAFAAAELDAAQKALVRAYKRRDPEADKYQQRWDALADEMRKLNSIVRNRIDLHY